jgi:hypothetical protein
VMVERGGNPACHDARERPGWRVRVSGSNSGGSASANLDPLCVLPAQSLEGRDVAAPGGARHRPGRSPAVSQRERRGRMPAATRRRSQRP